MCIKMGYRDLLLLGQLNIDNVVLKILYFGIIHHERQMVNVSESTGQE